jgi:ribosome-binding factor A
MNDKSILQLRIQKRIKILLQNLFMSSDFLFEGKVFYVLINNVDISADLRNLKIYIELQQINDIKVRKKIVNNLNKEKIYAIKSLLAKKINMRYVPEVLFLLDESNEKADKIEELLEKEKIKMKNVGMLGDYE